MSKAHMGATVLYCGHDASFAADIFRIGNVNVVVANGDLNAPGRLTRPAARHCTHHVSDVLGGCWKPHRGLFAVPQKACQALKPGAVDQMHGIEKRRAS